MTTNNRKQRFLWLKKYYLLLLITLMMVSFVVWYFVRHWEPYTQNAFVVANTRPVSVLVPGYLTEVHIVNNQEVKKNDPLFTIFRPPYLLAVEKLQYTVEETTAKLHQAQAQLITLQAQIRSAEAVSANADYLAKQAIEMYESLAVSQTYCEERTRAAENAAANLAAERANVAVIEAECSAFAASIKALESELALAKIYYEQSIITALSDGVVTNMYVAPGGYYNAGDVLCAFIDTSSYALQANFEETDLAEITIGQDADIWFWQYPGKTFHGKVQDIFWGVERRLTSDLTGVAVVNQENQWFLLPQRFPVVISIDDADLERYPLHLGGSAFVRVHTSARLLEQIVWRVYQW